MVGNVWKLELEEVTNEVHAPVYKALSVLVGSDSDSNGDVRRHHGHGRFQQGLHHRTHGGSHTTLLHLASQHTS